MATKKHSPADAAGNTKFSEEERDEHDRRLVALEAAWEVESIASELLKYAAPQAAELWKRGLLVRLLDLSSVIMTALEDHVDTVPSARKRLTGLLQEACHD